MMVIQRQEIMGIPFVSSTFEETIKQFTTHIERGEQVRVITANPEIVMLAQKNREVADILASVDYVTPDGIGIVIAGKLLKKPIPERITGVELTLSLLQHANAHAWRVYLLGAAPDVMAATVEKIRKEYPHIHLCAHHGYFTESEEVDIIEEIQTHKPHILLVALGAPKQEQWLTNNHDKLQYNLAMGVGGTFDVISGKVKRAPLLWQKTGVEWLYRLLQEPRRFKRMLALPQFLFNIFILRLRRSK